MSYCVFAYNFPHRKTQDFLLRLFIANIPVACVLASNPVKLDVPASTVRTKVRHSAFLNPHEICERFDIPYEVVDHNSSECVDALYRHKPQFGLVAGARILKPRIIDAMPGPIINFHPGKIPDSRGLDAMLWSIYNNVQQTITAHCIDRRVDAGRIIKSYPIPLYKEDTLFDISERLYEGQLEILIEVLRKVPELVIDELPLVPSGKCNKKMPPDLEEKVVQELFGPYLSRWST